jgi:hypothetical protein
MVESWDTARTIQRVIDPKYPNTRLIWQAFQAQAQAARAPLSQSAPLPQPTTSTGSRSFDSRAVQDGRTERFDRVVQRVIDNRYPETRAIWMASREQPTYRQTAGVGSRSFGGGFAPPPLNLPLLNRTDDPRRPGFTAGSRQMGSLQPY